MDLPSQGPPKPKPRGPAIAGPPMMDLPMTGVASPMGAIAGVAKEIVRAPTMLVARGAANGAPIKPALAVAMQGAARGAAARPRAPMMQRVPISDQASGETSSGNRGGGGNNGVRAAKESTNGTAEGAANGAAN
ncbi:hypothetical protein GEV33_004730 [Tenebrio molitor]|uniref:Uncharacterized protein n=1 Tax=Tenebrio molitor TaxID=7067 RepID=A0A8J6HPL3_TENMO|nr:hypothetical protein GEV33_004730 [Tenebrio molitor]